MTDGDDLLRLKLEPVDSLFFRDARPFDAASRAASGLPMPQTLAGAVRSLLLDGHGVDFNRLGQSIRSGTALADALKAFGPEAASVADVRVRGPWFALAGEVLMPVPASLRRVKSEAKGHEPGAPSVARLDPLEARLPGWKPKAPGMLPLWRHGREATETVDGFLTYDGLRRFLEGGAPEPCDVVPTAKVYAFEDRTGIGVDSSKNAAGEGMIYGIRMLALQPDASIYAEVNGPRAALAPLASGLTPPCSELVLMRFGGEARHVIVRRAEHDAPWPSVAPEAGKGRLVMLTTPAHFNGWKPPGLEPVAAAVSDYKAVSGWDLAKGGPKPNRFMVPAGSVYFLPPGAQAPDGGLVDGEDARDGWGCFVEGNWNHV